MEVIREFPHDVDEIENLWIPLLDGCRLAARIWMPKGAAASPVPAILEYIPYRKRDFTRGRDEPMHRYFAGHGYAAIRVDIRGSGDSDGILEDEYTLQELEDCLDVMDWIVQQPWCDGNIGMMGKSWGGFNSLQVAALRPPQLKAIITVCSTDDRYADDAHYMGGCLLNENLTWGSVLLSFNAYPPDPQISGENWKELWLERLEHSTLFPHLWMEHQTRDEYWKHGSVCEDYSQIECAVYAIGGWADAYSNSIFRLMENLSCPRKALVGPWGHQYPHSGIPGPAIGFLQEAIRWWDYWLKDDENGIMDEPELRLWMQESVPPQSFYSERPGRWVAESSWPSTEISHLEWVLDSTGVLNAEPSLSLRMISASSPQSVGLAAGEWCGFGAEAELPSDQREEDGKSLVFESGPLENKLEILGFPKLKLALSVDQHYVFIAVRLNDVDEDGASTRVTYGLLNLTHRRDHEHPGSINSNESFEVEIDMNAVAHSFPAGHRIRVAISTSYWPIAWPSRQPVTLRLNCSDCRLVLPVRESSQNDNQLKPFDAPQMGPRLSYEEVAPPKLEKSIKKDLLTNEILIKSMSESGLFGAAGPSYVEAIDMCVAHSMLKSYRIREYDPLSAIARVELKTEFARDDWTAHVLVETELSSDLENFKLVAQLEVIENGDQLFVREWNEEIPRGFL